MPSDKTIPQQIDELTQKTSTQAGRIVELEAALAAKAGELTKLKEDGESKLTAAQATIRERDASITKLTADVAERDTKLTAQAAEIVGLKAQVDKTTKMLAMHPDVAALFARGEDAAKLRDGGGEASHQDVLATYNSIKDRAARRKFYAEHKAQLTEAARK